MSKNKRYLRCVAIVMLFAICAIPAKYSKAEEITQTFNVPAQESLVQNSETEQITTDQQADAALQQRIAQVTEAQQTRQLVIIGDSRTVGMKSAVGKNNNLWSAKVGMGLSWMKSTGVPAVEASINANTDVVILMGVNDVRNLSYTSKYISYINKKAAAWKALGANVYYVSVNPMVFETKSYPDITNSLIESWNTKMQDGLSEDINYIDTYSQVLGKLSSKDGIHYNKSSYKLIYSLINQGIILDKALDEEYEI